MIDVILKEYLETELETNFSEVPVYMEQPQNLSREYVMLRMIDVGRINEIDAATFEVIIRSDSMYHTAQLRDCVKGILLNAITLDAISSAELGGGQMQVEPVNKAYQASLICNFYYYEEA